MALAVLVEIVGDPSCLDDVPGLPSSHAYRRHADFSCNMAATCTRFNAETLEFWWILSLLRLPFRHARFTIANSVFARALVRVAAETADQHLQLFGGCQKARAI